MILITGAAGFIGSAMVWKLNSLGVDDIIGVDKFHSGEKWKNLRKLHFHDWVDRDNLFDWLPAHGNMIDKVIHLGACSDTTEKDVDYLIRNNFGYSKALWQFCVERQIPYLYASSAATYGGGEYGYDDDHLAVDDLKPLNPYGWSKQIFDRWVLSQKQTPSAWYGFKFFNVYGPNEYHKGSMSSIIYHAFHQIQESGTLRLFKSHKDDCENGEQKRDFVYIKDVLDILDFFLNNDSESGLYNIGTGKSRSYNDLAAAIFSVLGKKEQITYIDMPESLRKKYQYFTQAKIKKLSKAGYSQTISELESGIADYVKFHLDTDDPYLQSPSLNS